MLLEVNKHIVRWDKQCKFRVLAIFIISPFSFFFNFSIYFLLLHWWTSTHDCYFACKYIVWA